MEHKMWKKNQKKDKMYKYGEYFNAISRFPVVHVATITMGIYIISNNAAKLGVPTPVDASHPLVAGKP